MKCTHVHKGFTDCAWFMKHRYYGYYFSDLILSHSTLQPHLLTFHFLHAGSLFLILQVLCPWSHLFSQAFPDHLSVLLSAHTYSPLSRWMSLIKHPFKDKIIKSFEKWQQSIKSSTGFLLSMESGLIIQVTSPWNLLFCQHNFILDKKARSKDQTEFYALWLIGWEINHPSSCKSPNQKYKLIIQKEG